MRRGFVGCNPSCELGAPVFLPAGALVSSLQLDQCADPGQIGTATLRKRAVGGRDVVELATVEGGHGSQAGCALLTQNLATPETIDNQNHHYYISVGLPSAFELKAVRLNYTL